MGCGIICNFSVILDVRLGDAKATKRCTVVLQQLHRLGLIEVAVNYAERIYYTVLSSGVKMKLEGAELSTSDPRCT